MKTKIGISIGIAWMLALGVFSTMLALGMFTSAPVEAKHITLGSNDVTNTTAAALPNDPGAATKMTFTFVTNTQLDALTDTIMVEFDDDVTVPTLLDKSTITITASAITNPGAGVTGSVVNNPLDVTVELVGTPKDEPLVHLTVPDMDPTAVSPALNSIQSGATVTVIFTQASGILNPTESKDGNSSFSVWLSTSDATKQVRATYHIPRQVLLSAGSGELGKTITVTGKGFENGTTATVWRDANADGTRDDTETTLTSALVGSDNIFTATFIMSKPPFVSGKGVVASSTRNAINAIDGEDNTINPFDSNYSESDIPVLDYQGLLVVTPTTAAIGDTVTIELRDFDPNTLVTAFPRREIGTETIVPTDPTAATDSNGDLTFDFVVPNGLPLGVVTVTIDTGALSGTETKDITIIEPQPKADLSITQTDSPDPVKVGEDLTYTIIVVNNGPSPATEVVLTQEISGDALSLTQEALQTHPLGCSTLDNTLTCSLGTLANGEQIIAVTAVAAAKPGTITSTATITSDVLDPDPANNSATETTTVQNDCTLELSPSYGSGTLTVDVLVGTGVPATAKLFRTSDANSVSLFSGALPVTDPPLNKVITESLPPSGTVALLATLTTPELGIICLDVKTVDTGSPP